MRERRFGSGAVLRTTLGADTGYLANVRVSNDVSPSGAAMVNEIGVGTDAGGRPTSITTTMGRLGFAWDGPVETAEVWITTGAGGTGAGVAGSLTRTVGAAMLLESEHAVLFPARAATIAYGYDADRLLTSAGVAGLPGVALEHGFPTSGATLTTTVLDRGTPTMLTTATATPFGELQSALTTVAGGDLVYHNLICARDEHGRITRRAEQWFDGGSHVVHRYEYSYDARGFLGSAGEDELRGPADPCGFAAGALLGADAPSWEYDAAGNRLDVAVNDEDQALVDGRHYDALGHLDRRGSRSFSYDVFGRLRSTSSGLDRTDPPRRPPGRPRGPPVIPLGLASGATYDYDGVGRLVAIHPTGNSAAGEQRFIYRDALNPIAWSRPTTRRDCPAGATAPTDTLFFVYASMPDTPDLAYVDTCSNGSIDEAWRYLTDERGSVRFVVNANDGTVIQEISYDAWGLPTFGVTTASTQPFGYIGGIYDAETGFWHLGARDYDPTVGRWTTKDPMSFVGGMNLFGYCLNDPVNCADPSGLWFGEETLTWLDVHEVDDTLVGFGDTISGGLGGVAREAAGFEDPTDYRSGYAVGLVAGLLYEPWLALHATEVRLATGGLIQWFRFGPS